MGAAKKLASESTTADLGLPRLEDEHFSFFQQLIQDKAGIRLLDSKRSLVSTRLARRLRARSLDSWDEYIDLLKDGDPNEMAEFTNVLTTNKSEFFRENKHFEYLQNVYFPELSHRGIKEPFFWVGASSNGQEVYSLDMISREYARTTGRFFNPRILATDIDTSVLQFAQQAAYDSKLIDEPVGQELTKRYFLKGVGENAGKYRYNPEFCSNIKFRYHNLCDSKSTVPIKFDVIMLRNVLIYFSPETVEQVISKMYDHLNPRGILILGHCEGILEMKWKFDTIHQSVYRKRA